MIAATPTLLMSVWLVCLSFCAMRWSGGGLFDVMVVVTSDWLMLPTPPPPVPPPPVVDVCVKVCVGDEAANSLSVWKLCD